MLKKAALIAAMVSVGAYGAFAQTNSSNPTQAPVSGATTPGAGAKTEQPGPAATAPGATREPSAAQSSSNPTQAPVQVSGGAADAKTENTKK